LIENINNHVGYYAFGAIVAGMITSSFFQLEFIKFFIPVALFIMLYPMMLDIRPDIIGKAVKRPWLLVLALVINFVLCPLLMAVLIGLFRLDTSPFLTIGLLLYASIPCGSMVPAFTGMLDGNITLSVTITAISLVLTAIIVPFWTRLLVLDFISVPIILVVKYLLLMIILPLILAALTRWIVIRKQGASAYQSFSTRIKNVSSFGLLLLCFIMFMRDGNIVLNNPILILQIFAPIVSFLLILLAGISVWCRYAHVAREDAIAIVISCSAKNNALSIALAIAVFGGEVAMINTIAGLMVQLPVMICFIKVTKNRLEKA
ncbi:MAG: bile acid:sodium symporter, partial [Proteobacteria bacterium]|nr:bile acid:sodium symporter [Pseudomonadota bacterium]